jgi:hypothetical protein
MYFGREQGLFMNRFEFIPRRAELSDLWQAQQMTQLSRATDLSLLPVALRWIAGYEQWVLTTCGASYRSACLQNWEAAVGTAHRLPILWQHLAEAVETALTAAGVGAFIPPSSQPSVAVRALAVDEELVPGNPEAGR